MIDTLRNQWTCSVLGSEAGLHQLSPYIGKLKSSIAASLIENFSSPGDLVFEPFAGSGCVALEALRLGRSIIACDISTYAEVLTRAKICAPTNFDRVILRASQYVELAKKKAKKNDYKVHAPAWVRNFFHRRTLAEVHALAEALRAKREWFLLACLVGILHHQRPGFLSFPSSHLVPYLRSRKFPREKFPSMYEYRDVGPRLLAKIHRAFKRLPLLDTSLHKSFIKTDIRHLKADFKADVVITSPPYMNALDYGRDNRLRLWFLGSDQVQSIDEKNTTSKEDFFELMVACAKLFKRCIKSNGRVVLVVGEVRKRRTSIATNRILKNAFEGTGHWKLTEQLVDLVPDIRRSRRDCKGTKREWIMVFEAAKRLSK
jgi:adenine-specific DNA methylase